MKADIIRLDEPKSKQPRGPQTGIEPLMFGENYPQIAQTAQISWAGT